MQNISNHRELKIPTIMISIFFSILVLFLFISSAQAETISISLMSNQSIEFINSSGSSFKVTSTGYYDYVIYDMQTGAPTYANDRYSSLTVNSGKRVIITNPNSNSITISSSSTAFNPVITQDAALYKFTLKAGKSYEFTNASATDDRNITNSSYLGITFDYVKKTASGSITWDNNVFRKIDIAKGGTTKVTVNADISCWYPRELYVQDVSYVEIPETALYEFTLEAGKSYEFTNASATDDRNITNSSYLGITFDYVKKTASGSITWDNNVFRKIDIAKGGTTKVTVNADISCWYPRELYEQDVSYVEIEETALYEFTLEAGKTYEFVNSTSSTINITNSSSSSSVNRYDYFRFDQNLNLSTGKSVYGSIPIYTGGRTLVYVSGTNNIYGWYPREIFEAYVTFNETEKLDLVYPTDIVHSFYQN
jgi:hypothetical protein